MMYFDVGKALNINNNLSQIISQYKEDKQLVFNTWFINNEDRLNAFRSIRLGVMQVVDDIKIKNFLTILKAHHLNLC